MDIEKSISNYTPDFLKIMDKIHSSSFIPNLLLLTINYQLFLPLTS
jgi:hypothetical protein